MPQPNQYGVFLIYFANAFRLKGPNVVEAVANAAICD
jgi:hypothetical protein